jgi:hypothetical protein
VSVMCFVVAIEQPRRASEGHNSSFREFACLMWLGGRRRSHFVCRFVRQALNYLTHWDHSDSA